jgi:hypothetical protein
MAVQSSGGADEEENDAFIRRFTFSKSWRASFCHDRILMYADDYSFERSRHDALDKDFALLFAETEDHMLESIAAWCGGWRAFVQARRHGASPVTTPVFPKDAFCLGDINGKQNLCKPVVIIDIHCDNEWKWSAFHPITDDDLENRNEKGWGFALHSTSTMGDQTDLATIAVTPDLFELETRGDTADEDELDEIPFDPLPSRYLLTTDANDAREYKISASIVSPNFAETLISRMSFVPQKEVQNPNATWEGPIHNDPDCPFPASLRRHQPSKSRSSLDTCYLNKGEFCKGPWPRFEVGFYFDKRHDTPRFHVMFERMIFHKKTPKMLVKPPAPNATSTMTCHNKLMKT